MLWVCVLGVFLGLCFVPMFWACVFCICFRPMFWVSAWGVCFACRTLERIVLGASLWVRGFGCMSLGVCILPKKPETSTK